MRHDLKYRRVLKTKEQYLGKYKTFGIFVLLVYAANLTLKHRRDIKEVNNLSEQMRKLQNEETEVDPCK